MLILWKIIVAIIVLAFADSICTIYSKIINAVNKKYDKNVETVVPIIYPSIFIVGGIIGLLTSSNEEFFQILKDSMLFGISFLLIYINIKILKDKLFRFVGKVKKIKTYKK